MMMAMLGVSIGMVFGIAQNVQAQASTKIAFTSERDGNFEIYVMNADGTGQTNLTNNPATDVEPSFSPDGTKIAFRSNRNGNDQIYVMTAYGSGQTNLSNNMTNDLQPSFSLDGMKIAFRSQRDRQRPDICDECGWLRSDQPIQQSGARFSTIMGRIGRCGWRSDTV